MSEMRDSEQGALRQRDQTVRATSVAHVHHPLTLAAADALRAIIDDMNRQPLNTWYVAGFYDGQMAYVLARPCVERWRDAIQAVIDSEITP